MFLLLLGIIFIYVCNFSGFLFLLFWYCLGLIRTFLYVDWLFCMCVILWHCDIMVKYVSVALDDEVFEKLKDLKGDRSWQGFFEEDVISDGDWLIWRWFAVEPKMRVGRPIPAACCLAYLLLVRLLFFSAVLPSMANLQQTVLKQF